MIADFHTHSMFSGDADTNPQSILDRAVALGMKQLCFTDHHDFEYNYDDVCFELDDDAYFDTLLKVREKYASKIDVIIGIEMGLEEHLADKINEFLKRKTYDFIIGSTHLVEGVDPYHKVYFNDYGEKKGIERYFEYVLKSVKKFENFDVYGHLDYVVRYTPSGGKNYVWTEYIDYIDEILKTLILKGKGIELNTGGLYKGMSDTNPHPDIIKRYKDFGGEIITVGADSHSNEYIGYAFDKAEEILKSAGFSYYTVFKERKPQFIKL